MDSNDDLTGPLTFLLFSLLGVGFLLWTSAHAAAFVGDRVPLLDTVPVSEAVIAVAADPGTPHVAWADPSIGHPAIYWTFFTIQVVGLLAAAAYVHSRFRSSDYGLAKRSRLKTNTEAALATPKDLKPIVVDGFVPDRFSLGKIRRHHLAAENRRSVYDPGPQNGKAQRQAGDRGPVMFVGPTRSGKSVGVISGILTWHGPIIAASIKDDLLRPTVANRRLLGQTAVFDPTESIRRNFASAQARVNSGNDPTVVPPPAAWTPELCVSWSPLASIHDYDDALRVADAIADAAPGPNAANPSKGDFWINSARQILAPFLYIAALNGQRFEQVVDWCIAPPNPDEVSPYKGYFTNIRASLPPDKRAAVKRIESRLNATLDNPDVKSSLHDVFATLRTIVDPWFSERLAASASGPSVDLDWLLGGGVEQPRSLYLVAPPNEAKRLQAVFGGCVNELIRQVYNHVESHGPIEPPLLIVLDEAANMPLPMLPQYASTLAGLGVQLVTVFQDFGQIYATYGHDNGGSIISNHTSRLFFRGIAEENTTKWIENATGAEEVDTTSQSNNGRGSSDTHASRRLALLPSNVVRQQPKLEALLIHGGLPPAHIESHQWFANRELARRSHWPTDIDPARGLPQPTAVPNTLETYRDDNGVAYPDEDSADDARESVLLPDSPLAPVVRPIPPKNRHTPGLEHDTTPEPDRTPRPSRIRDVFGPS